MTRIEHRLGKVRHVIVESRQGKDLALQNPWVGRTAVVYRQGKAAEKSAAAIWQLKTVPGEKFVLAQEGDPAPSSFNFAAQSLSAISPPVG